MIAVFMTTETLQLILPLMVCTVWAAIILASAMAWPRPEVVPMSRLTMLAVAVALITSEAGGYTQILILILMFVFMER